MDPDATLREIDAAISDGDETLVVDLCADLQTWINRGGFEPEWERCPEAAKRYEALTTS